LYDANQALIFAKALPPKPDSNVNPFYKVPFRNLGVKDVVNGRAVFTTELQHLLF